MSAIAEQKKEFISKISESSISMPDSLIKQAKANLQSTPFPTTRDESWKYTRVAKIGKIEFQNSPGSVSDIKDYIIDPTQCNFVFVNGNFSSELSTRDVPNGVHIELLSEGDSDSLNSKLKMEGELFNSLNTAHLNDGVKIRIEKNAVVENSIQVLHILDGVQQLSNFKTIIQAEDFSKASIVQGFFSTEANEKSFSNVTSEIAVGINAFLNIDKIQFENDTCFHINTEKVEQDKNSTFTINTITLNGALVRNNLNIDVNGENCTSNLNGAYILKGTQHVDNHTIVDHKAPNCNSNELYKGVMDDKSTGVFNGKVYVRQDSQKINAFQSNRNVLLSDSATINSKPELEIYADDVKCSHGSTTGQLDEEAIFYLRARGLSEISAKRLLVSAFIAEVLEHVENEHVIEFTYKLLKKRFGWDLNPEDFG